MNFNYEAYILSKLSEIQTDQGLSNFNFEIETEQAFIKRRTLEPDTIYIIIKYLADTKQIGAKVQPIQLLILSEQDSLDVSKLIFDKFAQDYNWKVVIDGSDYIKQQYSQPVVLANFNPVAYGYRSVMYVSTTLYVMENYTDITDLTVDSISIEAIDFSLQYSMSTNTQQQAGNNISTSVKNASTVAISMTIPAVYPNLIKKIRNTVTGTDTGNYSYPISFKMKVDGDTGTDSDISYNMKLTSAILITAPNQVPSWKLGFTL